MKAAAWVASVAMAIEAFGAAGCGAEEEDSGDSEAAIAGPAPDYVVSALGDPPAAATPGATFSAGVTVVNQGTAAATAASTTRYFLSLDTVVGGDRAFAATTAVPALAVGASDTQTVSLVIPSAPAGAYHVIACADRNAVIPELDNKNNCRASAATVSLVSADLVVDALSDPPLLTVPNTAFQITDTTRNAGTAPAGASKVAYFLSTTPVREVGARRLQPARALGAVAAGATSTGSVTTFVPILPLGTYYLIACADIEKRVVEADEQNNCRAATGTLSIRAADLAVTALGEPPAAAIAGDVVDLAATTTNIGNLPASFSSTRFFLSLDVQPGGDLPVVGGQLVPSLAEGQASAATTRIGIPDTTPTGSYYLLACADASSRIAERSEENCRASSGQVAVTQVAAAPALVTVQLLGHQFFGDPEPGQPVLAYDAAGALTARVATDASGAAEILVPAGGSLTVVELVPSQLTTFYGLEDGDSLTVGDLNRFDVLELETTVTVPVGTTPNNAYILQGPCSGSDYVQTEVVPVFLRSGCVDLPTTPMMATLFFAFGNELMGYIYDPDVDLGSGTPTALDGEWQPPFPFHLDLTGIAERYFPLPDFALERMIGPMTFYNWQLGANGNILEVIDGHTVGTLYQGIGGDGTLTDLRFIRQGLPSGVNNVLEYRTENQLSLVADVTADLVTMPTDTAFVRGELEPGGPTDVIGMTWTMDDGAAVDGVVVWVEKFRDDIAPSWTIVMPPRPIGVNQIVLPPLPPDLVPVWAGGEINWWTVYAVDSLASSYAEFRRDADPQRAFQWRRWRPTIPGKTRTGSSN
jgi:hypothetical protein